MYQPELDALERSAYRSVVDDGLIDILLGLFFLTWGLTATLNAASVLGVAFLIGIALWKLLRRTLIEPRVGHVQLSSQRLARVKRGRRWMALLVFSWLVVLVIFVMNSSRFREPSHGARDMAMAVVFANALVVGGYLLELRRWYGYSVVLVAGAGLVMVAHLPTGSGAVMAGGAITLSGFWLLAHFLRSHPRPADSGEVSSDG